MSKPRLSVRSDQELQQEVSAMLPGHSQFDLGHMDDELYKISIRHGLGAYSLFLQEMFHLSFEPTQAKEHWEKILAHHQDLSSRLSEPLDFRACALDYFVRHTK